MLIRNIKTSDDILLYIVDRLLAGIYRQCIMKRKAIFELKKQIDIAQVAIDKIVEIKIDYSKTRIADVMVFGGSVNEWSKSIKIKD